MASHDETACPQCDTVPPAAYRRHWKHERRASFWHVMADGPHLLARVPKPAHFVTILSYRLAGDTRHYHGQLYGEWDGTNGAETLQELLTCLNLFHEVYDLPWEAIHVWHSGGRGYHLTIPPLVFGAEDGHPQLPLVYQAMIEQLFPPSIAPSLDRTIYSAGKGRMWRLPNRRRSDTGRCKIPLSVREVLHKAYAALEALTRRPRKGIFWPPDDELSACPALVELYHETIATLKDVHPAPTTRHVEGRIRAGERNATLASLAGAMRRRGASQEAITAALRAENQRRCDPPLTDAEVAGIAASIARYQPTASATSGRWPSRIIVEVA